MSEAVDATGDAPPDRAERLVADLDEAATDLERARERVSAVGEAELERLADVYGDLTDLFDRYEERVTGDGDFETFIEFQGKIERFTENLSDVRHREVFEDVDDLLQQRRLTESDWKRVRETLAPVREDVERLEERSAAHRRYRDARAAIEREIRSLDDRISDLERLQRLGEADLDAPVERLRDPVERYNERVREAFQEFRHDASARAVLDLVAATEAYPLVDFRSPPEDLQAFVAGNEVGTEPIRQLLEYADYSQSKLAHYVDDPDELKRNVATQQTYLQRLDADPLTVGWPPPTAGHLRYRCRELTSVLGRFAEADAVESGTGAMVALREVRALPTETDYDRLRASAAAREQLGPEERTRLERGAVEDDLAACRAARETLADALSEYPDE